MSPIRPIPVLQRLLLFSFSAFQLLSFSFPTLRAEDEDDEDDPPPPAVAPAAALPAAAEQAYQRLRNGTLDVRTLAEVLPLMVDPARRAAIRAAVLEAKKPPRSELASLLQHPILAVRLGALELLEEQAGGDLSYNPWLPADAPENRASFARWKAWSGEPAAARDNSKIFTDDQRRAYLRDILGEDADKASRARRMLEAEGLSALGFLETFLAETPTLSAGGRAKIREAQYQITLTRQLGGQAAVTARQLAFGSRDQILTALATTRTAGLLALPILRDFITNAEPLVRETAIDSILVVGGEQAVPIVAPLLATEPDVNVIHGALRRLKDIPGPETEKLVASFLTHSDEDLLVSAIQTSLTLSGGNQRYTPPGSKKKPADTGDAIIHALTDTRWRVRAAALEFVAKTRLTKAKDNCLKLLDDPDEFVRFAAIKAIVAMGAKEAVPKLKAMFMADEAMAGPVIEGYGELKSKPDAEVLAKLDAASPDAKLAAIRAMQNSEPLAMISLRYAADPDTDVACAALRHIAGSNDLLKTSQAASIIVTALRSNSQEKTDAILERLTLPSSSRIDPRVLESVNTGAKSGEPTALDPLYEAFMGPGAGRETPAPGPRIPAAQAELVRELTRFTTPETPPGNRFRASLNLARTGQSVGYTTLLRDLPSFTTAQKIAVCEDINRPSKREALELLGKLLRDPVPEVRSAAANCALSEQKARALIQLVLDELAKPGGLLQPHEVYGYRLESAIRDSTNKALFRTWCQTVLNAPDAAAPLRVLATIASQAPTVPTLAALKQLATSPDPILRRAAWHALLIARPGEIPNSAAAVAADKEAFVREVLPVCCVAENRSNHWLHRFSDAHAMTDDHWSSSQNKLRLNDDVRGILQGMSAKDPSPLIRFEASFALLTHGVGTDLNSMLALLPQLSKETNATRRIASWLEDNAARATPALSPLLAVVPPKAISADKYKILLARIQPKQAKGFATFASLAETTTAPDHKSQPLLTADTAPKSPPKRQALEVIYFYKPGCPECEKAKRELDRLAADFPLLKVSEHNILESSGTVFNQALCVRFEVPAVYHSVSPAVFTQAGFLIRDQITPKALAELLVKTMTLPENDSWCEMSVEETRAAATEVTKRFEALTPAVVILGGLFDGINPCAFATIIFFLSYLQIARRTPREMLAVGAAFILAVFLAYLAIGLLLNSVIDSLTRRFAGVQFWLNLGFGLLALLAAALSFRDAFLARGGRLDEMSLQLPAFLKTRIRKVIRVGAKARNFVIAAFISGILISLLELACTGQVYAPIIYQIQQGSRHAVFWLVIYNLAFIAPLIVIFLLAYGGLRSETLVAFQKKHTSAVKTALGILFLVLALVILLGSRLFGG